MSEPIEKKTNPKGRKVLKWAGISVGALVALVLVALLAVSIFLTPERLTGLINKYAGEYFVNADFKVERAELTVWRTFPHAEVSIDRLSLVNTDPATPAEGDSVASVEHFSGRINLAALLIGRISVNKVEIDRPCATLWQGPDSLSNLNIFPPSEPKEEDDEPLSLPSISLDRFRILGDARFRYISVPDSINADLTIRATDLVGSDGVQQYLLTTDASAGALPFLPERLSVGLDGGIGWEPEKPLLLALNDFKVNVDSLHTVTSAELDFNDGLLINSLDFALRPLPLERVSQLIEQIPLLETPAQAEFTAKLLSPYRFNPDTFLLPDLKANMRMKPAPLAVPEYHLDLSELELNVDALLSAEGLDKSTVDLKTFKVKFPGTDCSLTASATNLETDPKAEGCFKGFVNFNGLDARLWALLGMRLRGTLDADVDFDLHLSDLTPNTFHRADLKGQADLRNFVALMPADTIAAWTRHARLDFGSSELFKGKSEFLTARLSLDTARVWTAGLQAELSKLKLGLGVENSANTLDTTTVTPMGGKIELERLRCLMADSSRAMIRGIKGGTVLTRYKGDGTRPLLAAKVGVDRMVYADATNRMSISRAELAAKAHLAQTGKRERRSISGADSVRMKKRRDSLILSDKGHERVDFGVDRSLVRMLRQWDVRGSVKANRARMFTPVFPLRIRMSDLNFAFNPDSLSLKSITLRAGDSDFRLDGLVSNMQKSLGRKRGQPLHVSLNLNSDTINVNELTRAAFRGAAWQAKADSISGVSTARSLDLDDDALETSTASEADESMRAIVVPMNVDASLSFRAKNIIYSTILLRDFSGEVTVADGAAQLTDLQAFTDMGSANANLIYYAPTVDDVDVGLSVELNRFRLDKVTNMIPALDSLMPLLNNLGGVVDVNIGATTRADSLLNIDFPSLRAMVSLTGDSLRVLDEQTFKTMSKWLLFHDKKKNMIDHMEVELAVEDNTLEIYPFMFDFDRYRIGVMGHNDLDMNLNYHVSILKSPIPFKFGVNIKGNANGKLKIRPGLARFKEKEVGRRTKIADTLRVNLAKEIKGAIKRGAKAARVAPMKVSRPGDSGPYDESADTLSHADSLYLIEQGILDPPPSPQQ